MQKEFDAYVKSDVHALVPDVSELEERDEPDPVAMHCVETAGRDCSAAAAIATERD